MSIICRNRNQYIKIKVYVTPFKAFFMTKKSTFLLRKNGSLPILAEVGQMRVFPKFWQAFVSL